MKLPRNQIILALALAAGGAFAQSNNVPGAADYASFSKFVTDRNIFDPNRQPHYTSNRTRTRTRTRVNNSAPQFSLVGTMAYEKGMFAFFNGNNDELKQALSTDGKIAGYTVTDVSKGRTVIESADKKQKIELHIGDVMRQENGKWELSGQGEVTGSSSSPSASSETASPAADSNSTSTPSPASEPNDVIKRLMEKRAKENQ
jgi:hypothetical protein